MFQLVGSAPIFSPRSARLVGRAQRQATHREGSASTVPLRDWDTRGSKTALPSVRYNGAPVWQPTQNGSYRAPSDTSFSGPDCRRPYHPIWRCTPHEGQRETLTPFPDEQGVPSIR